ILTTTNGGDLWTFQSSGTGFWLYDVSFIDINNGLIVGDYGTIIRTTNAGATWSLQLSGTTNDLYGVCFIDKNNGTAVGRSGTILTTTNGGDLWTFQSSGTGFWLYDVSFIDINNGWTIGEYGFILHTTNGGVTFIEEEGNNFTQPNQFLLQQNYPNPFNPSTKISWQSPVGSWQTLKVYDILGNEVATLVNEYRDAGSYEVDFTVVETLRATSLPSGISTKGGYASGVYFYRLQSGSFIETKKMILLK
ncbi:MAG: YCF48-related protein, partial [Ignavibacteria bacterium]|nr:YCF48-related protein [Ignavibacteria bacterium]